MDFLEQTVRINDEQAQQKNKLKHSIFSAVFTFSLAFALVLAISILFSLIFSIPATLNVIGTILFGVIAAISYFIKDSCNIEYDYLVDGEDNTLTVAKIKNLEKRKEVLTIKFDAFKRIEPFSKERFDALQAKKLDFSLNGDDKKYILFAEQNGQLVIVLEPNEALLSLIRKALQ